MGYVELVGDANTLADAIDMGWYEPEEQVVKIACMQEFSLIRKGGVTQDPVAWRR
jgi:hypothetical protein